MLAFYTPKSVTLLLIEKKWRKFHVREDHL